MSRSAAMTLTGHKTEAVYRRAAIVPERDLLEAGEKLPTIFAVGGRVADSGGLR